MPCWIGGAKKLGDGEAWWRAFDSKIAGRARMLSMQERCRADTASLEYDVVDVGERASFGSDDDEKRKGSGSLKQPQKGAFFQKNKRKFSKEGNFRLQTAQPEKIEAQTPAKILSLCSPLTILISVFRNSHLNRISAEKDCE